MIGLTVGQLVARVQTWRSIHSRIIRYVLQQAIKISREDQAIVLTVFKASLESRVSSLESRVSSLETSLVSRDEILVSREGGNLLLSGTVCLQN